MTILFLSSIFFFLLLSVILFPSSWSHGLAEDGYLVYIQTPGLEEYSN